MTDDIQVATKAGIIVHIHAGVPFQCSLEEHSFYSISSDTALAWIGEHLSTVNVVLIDHRLRLEDQRVLLDVIKYKFPLLPVIVFSTQKLSGFRVFELPADGYLYAKSPLPHIEAYLRGFLMARGQG